MNLKVEYFSAVLAKNLQPSDVHLPVGTTARADLLALLSEPDAFTLMAIRGDTQYEVVKVRNVDGELVLERGAGNTTPVSHHCGSCLISITPLMAEAMKEFICNYNCCEGDCECEGVAFAGAVLPQGYVNLPWEGAVVFTGNLPITIVANGLPSWMKAESRNNMLMLSGTPHFAGENQFSVAATNCNGANIVSQALSVSIVDRA